MTGIVFKNESFPPVVLLGDKHVPENKTGTFISIKNSFSTPLYTLEHPIMNIPSGRSFFLTYRSGGEAEAELKFASGKTVYFRLPALTGVLVHYQFPVPPGEGISSFKINSTSGADRIFKLTGCGLEKTGSGFSIRQVKGKEEVFLQEGMDRINPSFYTFKSLAQAAADRFHQVQISFSYSFSGTVSSFITLELTGGGKTVQHRIIVRPGGSRIYFYSDEEGMVPDSLRISDAPSGFRLGKLEIKPFSRLVPMQYQPIPADLGVILGYKEASWRRNDFEIFSWSLFPDFLLLDFRDYALQAAFLKRMAFFLEKKGYAGRILTNEELKNLHGWNAHDYRAEDLALFFNTAAEKGFTLNPEEYLLADILVQNNILSKNGARFIPVSGGFLAFTKESSPRLRYLFITHEGYHGVFFSSPRYRQAVRKVWAGLSDDEKAFWMEFLGWKGYNIKDPYLVVNEFQAYLMQQKIENVNHYYKDYIIPKLNRHFPAKKEGMDRFLKNHPDHFILSAEAIQAAVSRIKGITAGELRCVVE